MRIKFDTINDLMKVRGELRPIVKKNMKNKDLNEAYDLEGMYLLQESFFYLSLLRSRTSSKFGDVTSMISDLRESDVTYYERTNIDSVVYLFCLFSKPTLSFSSLSDCTFFD